jgi:hypothetical protein
MSGVVSPALVWCHESDGSFNVELGRCENISPCHTVSGSLSFLKSVEPSCDSCKDSDIFIFGPNQAPSYDPANLIIQTAAIVASHPLRDSVFLPVIEVRPALDEITPYFTSIRSTVLLI